MSNEQSVEKAVKKFMATGMKMAVGKITPSTRIQDAFSLNDAQAFMGRFAETFHVDMSAFRIERYYGPVGPVSIFSYWIFVWFFRKHYGFKPLTAELLITAAKSKKWPAP